MNNTIYIERMTGNQLEAYIHDLARLRIEIFRDFPYLYDGNLDYESHYLRTYIQSPDSVIVIAFAGEQVVGAATAVPLKHETDEVKQPFIEKGFNPDDIFYLGESVLQKPYRGQGIGVRFFAEREAHAYRIGHFTQAAFCAVERPPDHPRCPRNYQPLDEFWRRRGYTKHSELQTTFTWQDLDESTQSPKSMVFWLKSLPR